MDREEQIAAAREFADQLNTLKPSDSLAITLFTLCFVAGDQGLEIAKLVTAIQNAAELTASKGGRERDPRTK